MQNQRREIENLRTKLRQSDQNRDLLERTLRSSNEQHIRDSKIINQLQNTEFALLEKIKNIEKNHSSQEQSNRLANEYQKLQQRLQTATEALDSIQNENFQMKQTFEHEIEQVLTFFPQCIFPSFPPPLSPSLFSISLRLPLPFLLSPPSLPFPFLLSPPFPSFPFPLSFVYSFLPIFCILSSLSIITPSPSPTACKTISCLILFLHHQLSTLLCVVFAKIERKDSDSSHRKRVRGKGS